MDITDSEFETQLSAMLDAKTKPVGALGHIEELAASIARIYGSLRPRAESCALAMFAGDHGMAESGVSAYPQVVTRQLVLNFLTGGASANVFASSVGAAIQVVDAGITGAPILHAGLIDQRVASGTRKAIQESALTLDQLDLAMTSGRAISTCIEADVACLREMEIGNTSSASLMACRPSAWVLRLPPAS